MNLHLDLGMAKYLFLDRDGVINKRIVDGYVTKWEEFEFLPGVTDAIARLGGRFQRIVVITNQQGVGKGLMTRDKLDAIHVRMTKIVENAGGRIDAVFCCTDIADTPGNCRKPGEYMGLRAKEQFPEIDFRQSIMVGDSVSDMKFASNLGMVRVFIHHTGEAIPEPGSYDYVFDSLKSFAEEIGLPSTPAAW